MTDLFSSPVLRVEQPRVPPGVRARYKVYDGRGTLLAKVAEQDVPKLRQAFRSVLGDGGRRRTVYVENAQGAPLLALERDGTRATWVSTPHGGLIGSLRVGRFQHRFNLLDAAERPVGKLDGNRLARRFRVLDGHGAHVAQLDKKWKGLATEMLTTADRYTVEIFQPLYDPLRVLVAAAPIAIDLMLYESKDWPIGG
ncbi:phospholipid scramblase-related protein [Spirillospora sp. NPDC029432]|uniref:phospholipid scramblase-related protein n=1 Tax=Spirillospora sp. NPDC029432 TaxID=3154599 RepID=UPI0034553E51